MCEIQEYSNAHKESLIHFMSICLPETGRAFELEGKHKMYQDVLGFYTNFWCLVKDEEVIRTVAIKKMDNKKCELKAVFVLGAYQGKGFGYQLTMKAINEAKVMGYEAMYLDVSATSKKAISLYHKVGFVETERYNDSTLSEVFMRLDLTKI